MQDIRKSPKISIIMAAYNQAPYIEKAVNSVLEQTYSNFELILIDDCSPDGSAEVVKSLATSDPRIKAFVNSQNLGCLRNKQKAFGYVTGKYCTVLDADDYWTDRTKLEKQAAFLETNPEYSLTGGQVMVVDKLGKHLHNQFFPLSDDSIRYRMLIQNPFGAATVMFRTELAKKSGGFRADTGRIEDFALWLELGRHGKMQNTNEVFLAHRLTGFNVGETERGEQIKSVIKLVRSYNRIYPNYWLGLIKLTLEYYLLKLPLSYVEFFRKIKREVFSLDF